MFPRVNFAPVTCIVCNDCRIFLYCLQCLDAVATVHALARLLRSKRSLVDVIAISSAKVPIVKFRHSATRIESDISVYNLLGQRNSQLLATYAAIDARVRVITIV